MSDTNVNIYTGRLARDPETKQAGESTVTRFTLAVGRKYNDKEETSWVPIEAWNKLGAVIQEHCKKGSRLAVVCEFQTRDWEKDGEKEYGYTFKLNSFTFLDSKKDSKEIPQDNNGVPDSEIPF